MREKVQFLELFLCGHIKLACSIFFLIFMSTFSPFRQFIRIARMTTTSESKKPLLALPATAEETVQTIGVNDTLKLKELGPVGKV